MWRSEESPDRPDPADLVDPGWDVRERSLVATYFEEGVPSPYIQIRILPDGQPEVGEPCQLCETGVIGVGWHTDGTYVWTQGLSHYARKHSVRIPSRVVDHILQQRPFDFGAIRDRAWDRIMASWRQGEHDRSWWKEITSQAK
jgi:hypothetical protein